jgi:hypothetical protein
LQSVISTKELAFIWGGWDVPRSYHFIYLLPSYVGAQALALESLASPPLQILSQGYHLRVKAFIDDETLEDVYQMFLSSGVDH